jgi:hypothetical protein
MLSGQRQKMFAMHEVVVCAEEQPIRSQQTGQFGEDIGRD